MFLLILLWILFFASHSLLAAKPVKEYAGNLLGGNYKYYRLAYNALSLGFLAVILYILLISQEMDFIIDSSSITNLVGICLLLIGFLIMILSFRNYDLGEFTGIKQLAQKMHHPEKLVVKGLNAYVRNPLYFGILIFILGFFLFQPTGMNLVSLLIIYAYIYIGTTLEEKKLEEAFGQEYIDYKKRVKRLLPYLF